jgi:hypothetical protein
MDLRLQSEKTQTENGNRGFRSYKQVSVEQWEKWKDREGTIFLLQLIFFNLKQLICLKGLLKQQIVIAWQF